MTEAETEREKQEIVFLSVSRVVRSRSRLGSSRRFFRARAFSGSVRGPDEPT